MVLRALLCGSALRQAGAVCDPAGASLPDVSFLQTTMHLSPHDRSAADVMALLSAHHELHSANETKSAAAVSGVELNGAGDLDTYLTGLMTDAAMIVACVIAFLVFRSRYPLLFYYGSISGRIPDTPKEDYTSWISAALVKKLPGHALYCGLDHAMLLEFTSMSMRLLVLIGTPMVLVMCPLNFFFGDGDAEKAGDNLSRIAIGNVKNNHPWLYYVYSFITLLVVWAVRTETFRSMKEFCKARANWLKQLQNPQANTVMVEGIPEEQQQDAKVKAYFDRMFGEGSVAECNVAKTIPDLETAFAELQAAQAALDMASQQWENDGKQADKRPKVKPSVMASEEDAIDYWTKLIEDKKAEVLSCREKYEKEASESVGGVNGHSAFVTFKDRRDARVAVQMKMSADTTTWQVDLKKVDADGNGEISSEELEAALGGGAQGSQAPSHEGAALYTAASSASQDGDEVLHVSGKIVLPHGKAPRRSWSPSSGARLPPPRISTRSCEPWWPKTRSRTRTSLEVRMLITRSRASSWGRSQRALSTVWQSSAPHFKKPKGEASRRGALKAWLKLKGSTTEPPMMGMAQIRSITKQCVTAPSLRKMGLRSSAMDCEDLDRRQAWFYSYQTGALQSAFGLCLSADLNGPPPSPGHAHSAEVLQGWISYRGPTSTVQWACDGGWGQTWTYSPSTGMFRLNGGFNEGMCLEQLHQSSTLVVALCDGSNFHQQFWFNSIDESKMLMQKAKTAADVPIFAKPYFDGEEAIKSKDSTYDAFRLAKFAKTRAVWYLSQGCSPVPTASCGTPAPDMPGVYVGESVLQLGKKVEMLPWQSAMVPSPVEGSSLTMCYYDHSCSSSGNLGTAAKLRQWTKGCNAGGKPSCRYCGSGNHPDCPKYYNCIDGGLATGEWTEEHRDWCCTKFSIGCEKPYHCLQGLENWRSWEQKRKDWCCSYQLLACEDECSKTDEATFRENHHFWCSSFGASVTEQEQLMTDYERFEKMLEKMYEVSELQPGSEEEKQQLSTARSRLPFIAGVALFLALGAAAALVVLAKQRSRNALQPVTEGFTLAAGQEEVLVAAA